MNIHLLLAYVSFACNSVEQQHQASFIHAPSPPLFVTFLLSALLHVRFRSFIRWLSVPQRKLRKTKNEGDRLLCPCWTTCGFRVWLAHLPHPRLFPRYYPAAALLHFHRHMSHTPRCKDIQTHPETRLSVHPLLLSA